jgi:hypothetical protein
LVLGRALIRWTQDGYGPAVDRPMMGTVDVITPPTTIAALGNGYPAQIDDAAWFFAS